jgi:hypothetical protein
MSKAKLIYILILIGIIFNAISLYFYQQNLEYILTQQKFSWYTTLGFVGDAFISIASVLSFISYSKSFPQYVKFCYLGLILLVTIASASDIEQIIKTPSLFYSTKGIGTFINFGILFFAGNNFYIKKIFNLFYILCFIYLFGALSNLAILGITTDRHKFLFAIREYTIYIFWVFPYFMYQTFRKNYLNILNYLVFFLMFVLVIATGSRGYIILYSLLFITKFYRDRKNAQSSWMLIIAILIAITTGAYVIARSSDFYRTIDSAFKIFTGRVNDDTRTDQLIQFFNQYNSDYLISGVGPVKTWFWTEAKGQYGFLDNQYIFIAWWAGLQTCLLYIFLLLKIFFQKSYNDVYNIGKITIGLWILACGGLAIYVTVSSELYYYFISLLMGALAYNQSQPKVLIVVNNE